MAIFVQYDATHTWAIMSRAMKVTLAREREKVEGVFSWAKDISKELTR